ncbi:bifunctional diguanylate cyclase/phosphodiesterase [Asanoa sp. WMMD1127]|uniref:putative bifunctional diguanylate cyclase/phosphodiesterase n=1 Tax=Asanoa sp. WMMD1127 TaxID=3016107 RepID=UPI002416903C|nr:bifunctional diguanylate cyclase/phosphodiesterase [Asanoa sp. WMMD1127]MDG4823487.1 bifunctional diguanylate cyclase/phosphodiesterase [Asanoa sp. WMMD1127]
MHFGTGAALAAAAGTLAAAVVTVLLVSSARARVGAARQAHLMLAIGSALAALTTAIALVGVLTFAEHWSHHQSARTNFAVGIGIGTAISAGVMCAGLLRLPWAAGTRRIAGRHLLDALVIAFALWFVGWVLISPPTQVFGTATPRPCVGIFIAAGAAALAVGIVVIVTMRGAGSRLRLLLMGCGAVSVAACGVGLTAGLCQAGPGLATLSGVVMPIALMVVAFAGRGRDTEAIAELDVIRRGTTYAFVPMIAMAVAGMVHVMTGGQITAMGIALGSLEGFALVVRQMVALRDVRSYAIRLQDREAHFKELAHTDPLTGLANRRGLLRALAEEVGPDKPCVLLGLDLDGFKNVNDMRGHDVGDDVLVEVGQRLRMNLRPGDLAARLGGDEFAVLMWAKPHEAQGAAERLLGVLNKPYEQESGRVFLSVSIGVAGADTAADDATLLQHADLALRYAKQRGKNRVERYHASYDQLLRRRTTLEHEMRGAIERGELHLAFQPVVIMPSVRPVGAEALLRWHHPELGAVRPDEFIPIAEECGMIAKLGAWVLHQACHQLSRWLADGHDVWVSVNVSPRELHAPVYVDQVAEALRAHRVPPQRLVLEVTEHAVATDLDELIKRLRALRAIGVRIALDDFGTGYSSLGQLRRLPIDILKIDHSLVAESDPADDGFPPLVTLAGGLEPLGRNKAVRPQGGPLVDIVVRLGHRLGLEVIAEGVTNQREQAAVVGAGCRFGQGQLFGWGVPAEHLEAMLDAATSPGARPDKVKRTPTEKIADRPACGELAPPAQRPAPTPVAQDVGSVDSSREIRQS